MRTSRYSYPAGRPLLNQSRRRGDKAAASPSFCRRAECDLKKTSGNRKRRILVYIAISVPVRLSPRARAGCEHLVYYLFIIFWHLASALLIPPALRLTLTC